jgi:hypothetical protein
VPQHQQLTLLIRAAVAAGALERARQERVRERLARDPLTVQRVGLAALARAVAAIGAVRAHVAHVVPATSEEHAGVPAPARHALHAPARHAPERQRPRLQRTMPVTGHAEVLDRDQPAAVVDDRRRQRLLVRIDPDRAADRIRQQTRPPVREIVPAHPNLLLPVTGMVQRPADNIPVGEG